MSRHRIRIGDWLLDHATYRLLAPGREHRLPRLQYVLLTTLVRHAGQTVGRDALVEAAWERQLVSDEVLSRQIATLRQLLGDDARQPRYIETLPKLGYRLVAEVAEDTAADPATPEPRHDAAQVAPATPAASPRRVPVPAIVALVALGAALAWLGREVPANDAPWDATRLSRERPLAGDPELERLPRLSRDGRWIAWSRSAPDGAGNAVQLARADGGGARPLFASDAGITGLAFSPDGASLAALERSGDGCTLLRFDLPDGPLRRIARCGPGRGLDWATDEAITATAAEPNAHGAWPLQAYAPDGVPGRTLTEPTLAGDVDELPRWSRAGRLAFARGQDGEQQLRLGADSGAADSALGPADRNRVNGIAWSADGRTVVVALDADGFPALHAIDVARGVRTPIGGRGAAGVDLGPDDRIVYEQRRYDANLWSQAFDGSPPRRLSPSARYDAQPALSPDGQRVAYVSNRDGIGSVWVVGADGAERRLELATDGIWNRPAWSADGTALLLTHYVDGRPRLARHAIDAGRTETPWPAALDARAGVEAADGTRVLLVGAGPSRLVVQRGDDAGTPIAGSEGVGEFRVGATRVAWRRAADDALFVSRLDAADATRTLEAPEGFPTFAWCFAGDRIAYARAEADGASLWTWDLDRDVHDRIGTIPRPDATGPNLVVDPALRRAIVARVDRVEADLMQADPP